MIGTTTQSHRRLYYEPRQPALLAQLVEHLHGKEGVNGSSPLEGFTKFCCSAPFLRERDDGWAPRRPPSVHGSPRPLSAGCGIAVADLLCVTLMRRPPSVHGSFNREGIQERDGVFAAAAGEVPVA